MAISSAPGTYDLGFESPQGGKNKGYYASQCCLLFKNLYTSIMCVFENENNIFPSLKRLFVAEKIGFTFLRWVEKSKAYIDFRP
jgi:hypothetical protein